jgi:FkbM family methyltransferase
VDDHASLPIRSRRDLRRLGNDCAWVVPVSLLSPGAVCYCAGAGEDISFDVALAGEFQCEVHTFDPTPRAIEYCRSLAPHLPGNFHFHPWGLWSRDEAKRFYAPRDSRHVSHSIANLQGTTDYFEASCKCLRSILTDLGHSKLTLLKLDIEGAEYEVLRSLLADEIRPVTIAVEFDEIHTPMGNRAAARIRTAANQLIEAGYVLVAQDGANYTFVFSGSTTF